MKKEEKKLILTLFAVYLIALLFVLFVRDPYDHTKPYWVKIQENYNYIPFKMIRDMLRHVRRGRRWRLFSYGVMNLAGNFFLFMPMGFFLPWLNKNLRRIHRTIPLIMLMITAAELIQLFTLRGFADVDDLILNTSGAVVGYLAFFVMNRLDIIS